MTKKSVAKAKSTFKKKKFTAKKGKSGLVRRKWHSTQAINAISLSLLERSSISASLDAELRRMAEEEWDAIPMDYINSLVLSFATKCARCKANKGGSAKR